MAVDQRDLTNLLCPESLGLNPFIDLSTGGRMPFNLDDTTAPARPHTGALDALLRDLPDTWTQRNEGETTWTAFDVVGHLNHGERTDWIPRVKRILESGETRPFDPFDRFAQSPRIGRPDARIPAG